MIKTIFIITITIALIGFSAVSLNPLLQDIIIFLNTYLDGMFQFIQYFKGLAESEFLMIISIFVVLSIVVGVVVK